MAKIRVHIVGAGSLGMLLAGRLAGLGLDEADISLVVRRLDQADAIGKHGLTVLEANGARLVTRPHVLSWYEEQSWATDVVLLAVKQQHIEESFAKRLQRLLGADVPVVCLQNGIGHIERLNRVIVADRLWVGVTTEGAKRFSDYEVEHTGRGSTWFGPSAPVLAPSFSDRQTVYRRAQTVVSLFEKAGFVTGWNDDCAEVERLIWRKLLVNAVINPLTASLHLKNGQLLTDGHARRLMDLLCTEALALSEAAGLSEMADLPDLVEQVCRATASNESSMLQDVKRGRRTEIRAITGSLLERAAQLGVHMPTHRQLYTQMEALEQSE